MSEKQYHGPHITVTYDAKRCIHAAECVRGLPGVFDTSQRPWINPDNAAADAIAAVVQRCPTGALHFTRSDAGSSEELPEQTTVSVRTNGPLYVQGDIEILRPDGSILLKDTRVALCRCGASANKPFCDGTHAHIGFTAE